MATRPTRRKNTKPKKLKRGQAIRVPGAGTVTISKDGAVLFRGTPLRPNPARKKAAKRATKRATKRTTKRAAKRTTRRARR